MLSYIILPSIKKHIKLNREPIIGLMGDPMKVNGKIIICMEKEFINGLTAEYMKENIRMIKKVGSEYIFGLTGKNMKVIGSMENNMEKENLYKMMADINTEYGRMANEPNGLRIKRTKMYFNFPLFLYLTTLNIYLK